MPLLLYMFRVRKETNESDLFFFSFLFKDEMNVDPDLINAICVCTSTCHKLGVVELLIMYLIKHIRYIYLHFTCTLMHVIQYRRTPFFNTFTIRLIFNIHVYELSDQPNINFDYDSHVELRNYFKSFIPDLENVYVLK